MNSLKYYLFVGIVSIGLLSCGTEQNTNSGDKILAAISDSKIQVVEVMKPQQRSFVAEVLISGTAKPNQQVTVYAMESGFVVRINIEIGDVVKKGELIAKLSNPELNRKYEEKKIQMDANKIIYERLKSTYEKTPSITPLQLVEEAEANYLTLKAEVSAIQDRLGFLNVRAPFAGLVTKRMVDVGALVQSGLTGDNPQGIVVIEDVSPIRLTIPLPESDVASINVGQKTHVLFPELAGESFDALVSRMAGSLDPASKTMQVEIDIENEDGLIKPGMYARIQMQVSSQENVRSLPITAQLMFQDQPFLLIVKDNKVERVLLRKGLANKDYFEVLNAEITESTLVIIQGKGLVREGQTVKPVLKSE